LPPLLEAEYVEEPKIVHLTVVGQHVEYATLSERKTERRKREKPGERVNSTEDDYKRDGGKEARKGVR